MLLRFLFSFLLAYCTISHVRAQVFRSGLLGELAVAGKITNHWAFAIKGSSLHDMLDGVASPAFDYDHVQSDVQFFAEFNKHPYWKYALGYHSLLVADGLAHRYILQLAHVKKHASWRVGNRFRFDQTLLNTVSPRYRVRYRIALEKPLSGMKLDPGEYYLLLSSEPILQLQSSIFNAEHRLGISIGRVLSNDSKLEVGLDYRNRNMLTRFSHRALLRVGWFLKL
jgi:hypothetical protein